MTVPLFEPWMVRALLPEILRVVDVLEERTKTYIELGLTEQTLIQRLSKVGRLKLNKKLGMDLALEEANAQGGFPGGRDLRIEYRDDGSAPEKAKAAVSRSDSRYRGFTRRTSRGWVEGSAGAWRPSASICQFIREPKRVAASSSRLWPVASTSYPKSRAMRFISWRLTSPHTEHGLPCPRWDLSVMTGMGWPFSSFLSRVPTKLDTSSMSSPSR